MPIHNCANLSWTLEGWRPWAWKLGRSMETGGVIKADIGPLPAAVPGSVQANLRAAGILPDWNIGVNSRACEWVEHRHWIFEATLPADWLPDGERLILAADGLDYSGWILVDGQEVAAFEATLIAHRFDLTAFLADGQEHVLSFVFDMPPEEQGQFGWTSESVYFKPRYNYSWDWCPRIVPIGFWDAIWFSTGPLAGLHLDHVAALLEEDLCTGEVTVQVSVEDPAKATLTIALYDGDTLLDKASDTLFAPGASALTLSGLAVEPWWPNGMGVAKTYTVHIAVTNDAHATLWETERRVGFKYVRWLPCEGAPEDAAPWLCEVNGQRIFLQGANWTPPRASYADTAPEDYQALIALYRDMGCNVLRVWGGGILEKEIFYDLCDEAGILVWQEFPLSSSGIENTPPEAPAVIEDLREIAQSYIRRRAHHVSLLCWCGGNELTDAHTVPVDLSHPCIRALGNTVIDFDPGRRFLPTSPSGPRFAASSGEYGMGLHHDVHGPWGLQGNLKSFDDWNAYWQHDDALFRSEVGFPAAAPLTLIERYRGGMDLWPPTQEYWLHGGAWWIQWERLSKELANSEAKTALEEYIRRTQADQAKAYATAARACKQRFPRCGGFIIWMGHDCFPCPANNSVIDFDRNPKPAYKALAEVFKSQP
ncbi:MAG: glycosyl hydrolase 2 galactose-binding domain-containing protein [Candidatus Hydrogenedentota bacterium]